MEQRMDRRTAQPRLPWKAIAIGCLLGAAMTVVLLLLAAVVLWLLGKTDSVFLSWISLGVTAGGAMTAGWVGGRIARQRGLLLGFLNGAILFLLLLLLSLFAGGIRQPVVTIPLRMAIMILSGGIGGLRAVNKRVKSKIH